MAQSDPHGGAQERPGEGDPAQQSESRTGSKRRRLSLDSTEDYYMRLQEGVHASEEEEEEEEEDEEEEKEKEEDDDDDDDDDDEGEDTVDGPGHNREELKSFKHFVQELEDDILPNDAIRRYSLYIESQKKAYFEAHKTEEWLRNKYHPSDLIALIERKKRRARTLATEFFLELENTTPATERTSEWIGSSSVTLEGESSAEPSLETRRLLLDIAQTQALALKLDTEKGIGNNILWAKNSVTHPVVKRLEGSKLFDKLLAYLWCVHGVVYYGMRESEEDVAFTSMPEDCQPSYEEDGWEEKLRLFWQLRLKGEDPLERRAAIKDIEAAVDKALDRYVVKVEDKSMGLIYGCGVNICSRPFDSVESVREHLRTRHLLLVTSLKKQLEGQLYYENYVRDPDAPVGLRNDDVQPSPKSNDHREVKTEEVEVNAAATSGNLNQHIQEVRGPAEASVDLNQYIQEIRSGDNILSYRCNLEGCTKVLDTRSSIKDHMVQDHRVVLLGLLYKASQDEHPQENSNNAVAPSEKCSSNNSAS